MGPRVACGGHGIERGRHRVMPGTSLPVQFDPDVEGDLRRSRRLPHLLDEEFIGRAGPIAGQLELRRRVEV